MSDFLSADVAVVTSGRFTTYSIVLPQSVLEELLREGDLEEAAVGTDGEGDRRVQEAVGVADVEKGDALLPDGEHSGVEGEDKAFALLVWGHFGLCVYAFWGYTLFIRFRSLGV